MMRASSEFSQHTVWWNAA